MQSFWLLGLLFTASVTARRAFIPRIYLLPNSTSLAHPTDAAPSSVYGTHPHTLPTGIVPKPTNSTSPPSRKSSSQTPKYPTGTGTPVNPYPGNSQPSYYPTGTGTSLQPTGKPLLPRGLKRECPLQPRYPQRVRQLPSGSVTSIASTGKPTYPPGSVTPYSTGGTGSPIDPTGRPLLPRGLKPRYPLQPKYPLQPRNPFSSTGIATASTGKPVYSSGSVTPNPTAATGTAMTPTGKPLLPRGLKPRYPMQPRYPLKPRNVPSGTGTSIASTGKPTYPSGSATSFSTGGTGTSVTATGKPPIHPRVKRSYMLSSSGTPVASSGGVQPSYTSGGTSVSTSTADLPLYSPPYPMSVGTSLRPTNTAVTAYSITETALSTTGSSTDHIVTTKSSLPTPTYI